MTLQEIRERVRHIAEMAGDPEVAHSAEDELLKDFVRACSAEPLPPEVVQPWAEEIAKSLAIEFERWCA